MAFRLVVSRGNHEGQLFIAVQAEVFVGREGGNDVILSDVGVSARHARLSEREGRVFIADLGTPNGTWVNGARIEGETELKPGDAIALGTAVVQFAGELEARKKLTPEGVATSPKASTGGRPSIAREADTEQTAPMGQSLLAREEKTESAGRPLTADEAAEASGERPRDTVQHAIASAPPGGVDTAAREKAAVPIPSFAALDAFAKVVASEAPQGSPPLPAIGREPVKLRPAFAPEAALSSAAPSAATARDLPPVPEGARITRDSPTDPSAVATSLAPNLPAAAEVLTTPAPVLVPAAGALRRPPDVTVLPTQVKKDAPGMTVQDAAAPTPVKTDAPALTQDDATAPRGAPLVEALESAADRARARRQAQGTLGGQLVYLWSELSLRARLVVGAALTGVLTVLGVGLWQVLRPAVTHELPPEPGVLTSSPIGYSFGLGDVDYEHPDFKELRFDIAAPTAVAVLVHYQAQDIAPDEVSIAVNGTDVGFVPADVGLPDRELEAVLSQFALKRNDSNVVVFDNTKNPPGHERWRISHLWMELVPVPETGREAALSTSRAALERGATYEKQHAAGDDMLFRAWRAYREGWLALLALRDDDRGPLFAELKRRSDAVRFALDTQCGTLMLDAKKQMELKNPDAAREILEGVPRFFPTKDHPCHSLAEEKLAEYEL